METYRRLAFLAILQVSVLAKENTGEAYSKRLLARLALQPANCLTGFVYRSRTLAKDVLNRLYSFIPVLNIELLQYYCSPFAPR